MEEINALIDRYGIRIDMVLGTALILIIAAGIIFYLDRIFRRLFLAGRLKAFFSYETLVLSSRVVIIVMWIGVGMLLLSFWGISMTGVWTVVVSIAAMIGVGFLAVWTMVSNITASVFITIWRPFYMGAHVELLPESLSGRVVDRNMMFTVLREKEGGGTLYIPNNLFFQKMFRVVDGNSRHLFEYFEEQKSHPASTSIQGARHD